jgi:hypothetical protein
MQIGHTIRFTDPNIEVAPENATNVTTNTQIDPKNNPSDSVKVARPDSVVTSRDSVNRSVVDTTKNVKSDSLVTKPAVDSSRVVSRRDSIVNAGTDTIKITAPKDSSLVRSHRDSVITPKADTTKTQTNKVSVKSDKKQQT